MLRQEQRSSSEKGARRRRGLVTKEGKKGGMSKQEQKARPRKAVDAAGRRRAITIGKELESYCRDRLHLTSKEAKTFARMASWAFATQHPE
jgi:hypothetical protein